MNILKRLEQILKGVEIVEKIGFPEITVDDIQIDSRKIKVNNLFLAVPGIQSDGHDFISAAIENGASVILCEKLPEELVQSISYIVLKDVKNALPKIVSNFFDHPDKKMILIGVTGTNGKTTIATLLFNLALKLGKKAGLISTIEYKINEESFPSTHTTPDILSLTRMFSKMEENGCEYAFMEVSSHAVDQGRVEGLDFDGAIFSNITRDHLDYHGTFKNYINAKKKFFDNLKTEAFALTNTDDVNGKIMVQNSRANIKTYSFDTLADFKGKIVGISLMGLDLRFNGTEAHFKLTGKFNAYNLLAAYGASILMGWKEDEVLVALSGLDPIEGRFEIMYDPKLCIHAIVDYAHTPDALENLLSSIQKIKSSEQRMITVFGAGGNRDKGKRPIMGSISARYSDQVVVTSDNPRFEDPEEIIKEIVEGIEEKLRKKVISIVDRKEAIKTAIMIAKKGDVIVVAGKGHENYQVIGDKVLHFSDRETIGEILKN